MINGFVTNGRDNDLEQSDGHVEHEFTLLMHTSLTTVIQRQADHIRVKEEGKMRLLLLFRTHFLRESIGIGPEYFSRKNSLQGGAE